MRIIAKDRIVIFNNWDNNVDKVQNELFAVLYKSLWLKDKLEYVLGVGIPDDVELKSLPNEDNFLDLSASYKEVSTI